MSEKFDPYHRWLAIPPQEQPPDHYRLLGLVKFESDIDVIDTAADRQMAHVRTYQSGKYADASQKLLNEIAAARVVLLDAEKKAAYDAGLRPQAKQLKQAAPLPTAQPLEVALPSPKLAPTPKPLPQTPAHVATSATSKIDLSKVAPLLLAGGAGLLVLLLAAGAGAWLIFGGNDEPQVVVVDPTTTVVAPVQPVVPPPVQPVDNRPHNVTQPITPVQPPVIDDPSPVAPPDDEPLEPTDPIAPVDDPLAEDPPASEPPPSPIAALFAEEQADERTALPDKAAQQGKREQVEGLFAVSSARSAAQRADMAQKLLDTARDTTNDLGAKYVLLEMARDVAGDGGHVALAMEAIDELDTTFQVDGLTLRAQSLAQAAPAIIQNAARSELVDSGVALVDELFADDKYVEAAKLIKALQGVAAKTRDKEQRAKLSARLEQGSELFKGFKDAQAAIETLKKSPDDAAAAQVAGKFYAFIKGDWQRGLVMLSLSSDAGLKSLAEKEMQVPRTSDDRLALADGWLKQAQSAKGLEADRQKARAAMWFRKVQGGLTGLAKVEVQRKLEAIGQLGIDGGVPFKPMASPTVVAATPTGSGEFDAPSSTPATRGKSVDLLAGLDLGRNIVRGNWQFEGRTLVSPPLRPFQSACLQIPADVPEEYDLNLEVTRVSEGDELAIGMIYQGKQCNVSLDRHGMDDWQLVTDRDSRSVSKIANVLPEGVRSNVRCAVRKDSIVVTVNGREIVSYRGPADWGGMGFGWNTPDRNALMLGAWATVFHVHSFKLTPLGGDIAPTVAAGEAVDLLALVDVDKHSVQGKYIRRGKSIVSPDGGFSPVLIPYHPPAEYQLTVDVTRKKEPFRGHDMAIGLVYQGKQCAVLIDRLTNTPRGQASWSTISADGAGDVASITNDTPVLLAGRRSRVVCTVAKNSIEVTVDGKKLLSYSGPATWTGLSGPWGVPDPKAIMLGGLQEPFEFHSLVLTAGGTAEAPAARGKSVDLLALVDVDKHAIQGKFLRERNELVHPFDGWARIEIPFHPPAAYLLEVELTRQKDGSDFAAGLVFQGKQAPVLIDAGQGTYSCIRAGDGSGRVVTYANSEYADGHRLASGRRTKIRYAVDPNSIQVSVDGRPLLTYRGDAVWDVPETGWTVRDNRALMIGSFGEQFRVHAIRLTPLAEGSDVGGGVSLPDWRVGKPIDLIPLIDVANDSVHGNWSIADGNLVVKAMELSRLQIPIVPPKNYVLEVEATRTDGKTDLLVGLVYQGRLCAAVFDGWGGGISGLAHDRDFEAPKISRPAFTIGQRSKIVCTVTEKSLLVAQDGKEVFRFDRDANWDQLSQLWRMPKPQALMLGAQSGFTIHSIKLTPQKELPTLLRGDSSAAEEPDGAPINLLPLVDLKVDAAQGQWELAGDSLSSPDDAETGIRLPYIPAQEYDLNLDITLASTTVDIELRLPYGGNHFMLHIDSSVDAKAGEPRPFRCEVRKTGITIFHNGKQAAKVDRDPVAKPMRDNTKTFEIITQNTPATFSRIRLTELGASGRPVRGPRAAAAGVYLDDLVELSVSSYTPLGKHGKTGMEGHRNPRGEDEPANVSVGGRTYEHALFVTPRLEDRISSIVYELDGRRKRLTATAGVNDQTHSFKFSGPMEFQVVGDGKILWHAKFTKPGETAAVDVDIAGVRRLELKTVVTGSTDCAWAVWIEPKISP